MEHTRLGSLKVVLAGLRLPLAHQMAAPLAAQDARPPHRRRLRGVARQLAPDGAAAIAWRGRGAKQRTRAAPAVAPPTTPVAPDCLLTESQLKMWIATGYLVLQVDDVPGGFHEQLYARACELHSAKTTPNMRQQFGAELAADSDAVLSSAKTRGALTSLLGPDFAGNAWNGGVLAADNRDQGFHRDNTSEPCRDPFTRDVSLFYYPGPCGDADGPTCFLPGTQYYGLDREGEGEGEERLETWRQATDAGLGDASSATTNAAIDRRRAACVPLLGVHGLQERRATHRGGTVVLWSNNVWHRRSRQTLRGEDLEAEPRAPPADYSDVDAFGPAEVSGVRFRPCVRVGFFRCSEPTGVSWRPISQREAFRTSDNWEEVVQQQQAAQAEAQAEGTEGEAEAGLLLLVDALEPAASAVLWQPHYNWMAGRPPVERILPARTAKVKAEELDARHLGKVGQHNFDLRHLSRRQLVARFHAACADDSEADRVRAAVALGHVSASEPSAVAVLITALQDPAEGVRRAAAYGLAQGGDAAVPALLQLLPALQSLQAGSASSSSPPVHRWPYQIDKLIFALGRAPTVSSGSALEEAAGGITSTIVRAKDRLSAMVAALEPAERLEMIHAAMRGNRGYDGKVCACLLCLLTAENTVQTVHCTLLLLLLTCGLVWPCLRRHQGDSSSPRVRREPFHHRRGCPMPRPPRCTRHGSGGVRRDAPSSCCSALR